jgi:hypothetical protein
LWKAISRIEKFFRTATRSMIHNEKTNFRIMKFTRASSEHGAPLQPYRA